MIGVIFAGGEGTRMREWISKTYGRDTPKVLIPIGLGGYPILYHTILSALEVFDDVYVHVYNHQTDIADYARECSADVITTPTGLGRSGALKHMLDKMPGGDIVTINAVDVVPMSALREIRDYPGNALLLGRRYYPEMPRSSVPNVVYYNKGKITGMSREPYRPSEHNALHTGISKILRKSCRHLRIGNIEDTLFPGMIERGELGYVGPIATWLPLKIPSHVELYRDLDIEEFRHG